MQLTAGTAGSHAGMDVSGHPKRGENECFNSLEEEIGSVLFPEHTGFPGFQGFGILELEDKSKRQVYHAHDLARKQYSQSELCLDSSHSHRSNLQGSKTTASGAVARSI